jgi:hypothetical protein
MVKRDLDSNDNDITTKKSNISASGRPIRSKPPPSIPSSSLLKQEVVYISEDCIPHDYNEKESDVSNDDGIILRTLIKFDLVDENNEYVSFDQLGTTTTTTTITTTITNNNISTNTNKQKVIMLILMILMILMITKITNQNPNASSH